MARIIKIVFIPAVVVMLMAGAAVWAQQNPKRLIMKDGSYQSSTKWEVHGDRVRYYSAERYDWEEIPSELVDWPATDKYNKERASVSDESIKEIGKADEADEHESPLVAPGLRLPGGGGVMLQDNFKGQPQLVE